LIAGGSISGLLAGREISTKGFTVGVFEEDYELGVPERCDGLVSAKGISTLDVPLASQVVQNSIRKAFLYSPGGLCLEVDATKQNVIVLNRKEFDRAVAQQASKAGAVIRTACRVERKEISRDGAVFQGKFGRARGSLAIDARGYSSLVSVRRRGALQGGKYVVRGSWFDRHAVELYFDNNVTPGFFKWVIPINEELAKVGAAGEAINPFRLLDKFVETKRAKVLSKIAGPIVTSGPLEGFVTGREIVVGEAAGQTKPTTGGGIYSGGLGGLLAGKAVASCLSGGGLSSLADYETGWRRVFGKEFRSSLFIRNMLGKLDNKRLELIFGTALDSGLAEEIASRGDFDFHLGSILRLIGLRRAGRLLGGVVMRDLRTLLKQDNR